MKDEEKLEYSRLEASRSEKERKVVIINSIRLSFKYLLDLMKRVRRHPYHLMNMAEFEMTENYNDLFRNIENQCSLSEMSTEDHAESDVISTFHLIHDLYSRGVEYLYSATPDYQNTVDPVFLRL